MKKGFAQLHIILIVIAVAIAFFALPWSPLYNRLFTAPASDSGDVFDGDDGSSISEETGDGGQANCYDYNKVCKEPIDGFVRIEGSGHSFVSLKEAEDGAISSCNSAVELAKERFRKCMVVLIKNQALCLADEDCYFFGIGAKDTLGPCHLLTLCEHDSIRNEIRTVCTWRPGVDDLKHGKKCVANPEPGKGDYDSWRCNVEDGSASALSYCSDKPVNTF